MIKYACDKCGSFLGIFEVALGGTVSAMGDPDSHALPGFNGHLCDTCYPIFRDKLKELLIQCTKNDNAG